MNKMRALIFVFAGSADDAFNRLFRELELERAKYFFTDYTILDEGTDLLENIPLYELDAARFITEEFLSTHAKEIFRLWYFIEPCTVRVARSQFGDRLKKLGAILAEDFCIWMPFFNWEEWDWSVPDHKQTSYGGVDGHWFAVPVEFEYDA